ncbi:hypothetical protein GYB61_05150 [bacterium]|nr:hypothetical protein [bacterium]
MTIRLLKAFLILASFFVAFAAHAAGGEKPVDRNYPVYAPAPEFQTQDAADAKSAGCVSCHSASEAKTMHANPGVILGCVDCHGGDPTVFKPEGTQSPYLEAKHGEKSESQDGYGKHDKPDGPYFEAQERAHVLPRFPKTWHYPSSANPKHSYTLLNYEAPEFIRFNNPSDYRVSREACGACHMEIIEAAERSLMATSAMFFGGAAYNNGILPFKRYILGEAYTRDGKPAALENPVPVDDNMVRKGIIDKLYPMPAWEVTPPADVFRVFERGGRNIANLFPETGLPGPLGQIQRLEEPGRPDLRQSNRAEGTGQRIAVPLLNMHKTRLNDPYMWFMGTNDNPGDFRASGCAGCHVVYANDREPAHSGPYAKFGHMGESQQVDPTIPKHEPGHPLKHEFTRAIPTSQCMICHMHQPNIFLNSFLGYTMWDYESDAPRMWPKEQQYPSHAEIRKTNERNPEGAAPRGKWGDLEFLKGVSEMNDEMEDTQFADYHGHGWNFRAIFKKDRKGNLLDAEGDIVKPDDPDKFDKAVHMSSIHLDVGMHCIDCHFAQDMHGTGHMHGEVAQAVEIECIDCHGTADAYPTLATSGPAAPPGGNRMDVLRTPDGKRRFEWIGNKLHQNSALDPDLSWELSLVKNTVSKGHADYNDKAARAKLMQADPVNQSYGMDVAFDERAHKDDEMLCITCHTSWTTSCAGCHLPIEANWKTERHHYEGGETRNYATYNPQVARDQMFQLGIHGEAKGNRIAPVRSSSALILSSTNANREKIYVQQPPIAASGFSSQAFAPHFPHTVRKTETKTCDDCHLSDAENNNAIMAQLLLMGTGYVNFVGYHAYVGEAGQFEAVRVTEWDEPQAVIGSYLHEYAYPDWYAGHLARDRELSTAYSHGTGGDVGCLQLRGEYLFTAAGNNGMTAYDVASVANKGFSQRVISAPFSPLDNDINVDTRNATCVALPTNQPINPLKNQGDLMRVTNQEQPFHPIYNYAVITDADEGLILVDVNTLADGDPRNNNLRRSLTWDGDGALRGARHVSLAGHVAYVATPDALVVVDLDKPLAPTVAAVLPLDDARASAVQFRFLWVTTAQGVELFDVTNLLAPVAKPAGLISLANARKLYLARTYAYVAAGADGLVIADIERPLEPKVHSRYTADGAITNAQDVVVGSTNASLFAYVADGKAGLKVVQLTAPDTQPRFYGFSPAPKPELIAWRETKRAALSLSRGLERDRAVDETGHQMAVFGRIGSRPFTRPEMENLFMHDGQPWFVNNTNGRPEKAQ